MIGCQYERVPVVYFQSKIKTSNLFHVRNGSPMIWWQKALFESTLRKKRSLSVSQDAVNCEIRDQPADLELCHERTLDLNVICQEKKSYKQKKKVKEAQSLIFGGLFRSHEFTN